MKKNNNIQNNIQSENMVNGSQHIQLGGTATYNNSNYRAQNEAYI